MKLYKILPWWGHIFVGQTPKRCFKNSLNARELQLQNYLYLISGQLCLIAGSFSLEMEKNGQTLSSDWLTMSAAQLLQNLFSQLGRSLCLVIVVDQGHL